MKIAIVGTGIAGLSAAWLLRRVADVTVYEQNPYAGGHTHTFQVPGGPAVDTGFIVFNERNYPQLTALFRHLNVASQESEMSFSASIGGGRVEYAGDSLNTLFAQRRNLFSPSHWRMLLDITRFNRDARRAIYAGLAPELTIGEFIAHGGYSDELSRRYLMPMAAAIWSCPVSAMLKFPAASFLKFFENHGLLELVDRPRWRTVTGGSHEYVKKLLTNLGECVRLDTPVTGLRRVGAAAAVRVWDAKGGVNDYDRVVMAVHADQVLPLLAGATTEERRILGAFQYQDNRMVLHSDARFMPRRRKVWAAWNYLSTDVLDRSARVSVSYWMNKLQRLEGERDYFVTLNPIGEPKDVIYETRYSHPVFTREAMQAQEQLASIQGVDRIWFCGAWCGYGFHEDGLRSAAQVAQSMGCAVPWLDTPEPARAEQPSPLWAPLPGEA